MRKTAVVWHVLGAGGQCYTVKGTKDDNYMVTDKLLLN
jgi:hypothetical protein